MNEATVAGFGSPDGAIWGFNSAAMHLDDTDWGMVSWSDDAAISSAGEATVDHIENSFTTAESYSSDWRTTHDESETTPDGKTIDSFTTTESRDSSTRYTVDSDDEGNYSVDDLWTRHLTGSRTDTITSFVDERASTVASIGLYTWSGIDNSSFYLHTSWGNAADLTSPTLDAGDLTFDTKRNGTYSGSEEWELNTVNGAITSGTYSLHDHSAGTVVRDWFDMSTTFRRPERPETPLQQTGAAVQGTSYRKAHISNASYADDSTLNVTYANTALQSGTLTHRSEGSQEYDNASGGTLKTYLELPADDFWFMGMYEGDCFVTTQSTARWNQQTSGNLASVTTSTTNLKTGTSTQHVDRQDTGTGGENAYRTWRRDVDGQIVGDSANFSIVSDTYNIETHVDAVRDGLGGWKTTRLDEDDTETSNWAGYDWAKIAAKNLPVVTTNILYFGNSDSFFSYHANIVSGKIDSGSVSRNATSVHTENKTVTATGSYDKTSGPVDPADELPAEVIGTVTVNDRDDRSVTDTRKINGSLDYAAGKATGTINTEAEQNGTLSGKVDHRLVLTGNKGKSNLTSTATGGVFIVRDKVFTTIAQDIPSATRILHTKNKLTTDTVVDEERKLSDTAGHTGTWKMDGTKHTEVDNTLTVNLIREGNRWTEQLRIFNLKNIIKDYVHQNTKDDGIGRPADIAEAVPMMIGENPQPVPVPTSTHDHELDLISRLDYKLTDVGNTLDSVRDQTKDTFQRRFENSEGSTSWSNGDSSRYHIRDESTAKTHNWLKTAKANGITSPSEFERWRESNSNTLRDTGGVTAGVPRGTIFTSRSDYFWKEKGTPQRGDGVERSGYGSTNTPYAQQSREWHWPDNYTFGDGVLDFVGSIYTNTGLEWLAGRAFSIGSEVVSWLGDAAAILSTRPDYLYTSFFNRFGVDPYNSESAIGNILARREWLRGNVDNLFRVAGGAFDMMVGAAFGWTGFGVGLFVLGTDQLLFGLTNLITGSHAATPVETLFTDLTGSATVGQLAPGVLSLGLWGAGRYFGRSRLLNLGEEVAAGVEQADFATRAQRAFYWNEYGDLIRGLRNAGREGITFDEFARLYPQILLNMSEAAKFDLFWTVIGRVSGALSRGWLWSQEVGVWVAARGGRAQIIINVGQRAYLPNLLGLPTMQNPGLLADVLAHWGHAHPTRALLRPSGRDIDAIIDLARRNPLMQPSAPIFAGPTGQWARYDMSSYLQGILGN
jgi:hypothetical protein